MDKIDAMDEIASSNGQSCLLTKFQSPCTTPSNKTICFTLQLRLRISADARVNRINSKWSVSKPCAKKANTDSVKETNVKMKMNSTTFTRTAVLFGERCLKNFNLVLLLLFDKPNN